MPIHKNSILVGTVVFALLASPAYGQSGKKKKKKLVSEATTSALILSESVTAADGVQKQLEFLNTGLPQHLQSSFKDQADLVRQICFPDIYKPEGNGNFRPQGFVSSVLGFLAPKLIGLFVKEVDKSLEKEIAKYSATHSKKITVRPYKNSEDFEMASPCFRYSRITEKQYDQKIDKDAYTRSSERTLDFDFIGQWHITDGQHIRIRPLRLYVKNPAVKKNSDEVSLAISAKSSAVWREDNAGRSGDVFNTIILKEKLIKPTEDNLPWTKGLKFYKVTSEGGGDNLNSREAWSQFQPLPIIPYSEDFPEHSAIGSLEISVAEVGDGAEKKILELAQKGLGLFKDDITSVLEEAAEGLLEKDEPVIETVEKYCATFTSTVDEDGTMIGTAQWTAGNETCD